MSYLKCYSCEKGEVPIVVSKADTFLKRLLGLAYKDKSDSALWIVPCGSIHTFWMRFDLHILFLDDKGKVIKVITAVPPRRCVSCPGARSVLEIPSDLLEKHLLPCVGSSLSFLP